MAKPVPLYVHAADTVTVFPPRLSRARTLHCRDIFYDVFGLAVAKRLARLYRFAHQPDNAGTGITRTGSLKGVHRVIVCHNHLLINELSRVALFFHPLPTRN